jgi:trimethylamine:corrinoid methyltransferase-like protein
MLCPTGVSLVHEDTRAIRREHGALLREHSEALARHGEMLEEILRRLPPPA